MCRTLWVILLAYIVGAAGIHLDHLYGYWSWQSMLPAFALGIFASTLDRWVKRGADNG